MAASLLINYFLVSALAHPQSSAGPTNVLAVIIFVLIAALVSRVVDAAAERRSSEAARSNAEAETLSTLAGSLLRGEQALPALLQRVQETFAVGQRRPAAPRQRGTVQRRLWSARSAPPAAGAAPGYAAGRGR